MFGFKKSKEANVKSNESIEKLESSSAANTNKEYALYVLVDQKLDRIQKYLEEQGIYPILIADTIENIKYAFIVESNPSILLVIESGNGNFSNCAKRAELVDLLGAGDESADKRVLMCYSDSAIKSEANKVIGRKNSIRWEKYSSTKSAIEFIKDLKITFEKGNTSYEEKDRNELMGYRVKNIERIKMSQKESSSKSIIEQLDKVLEEERQTQSLNVLPQFKVKA